MYKIAVKKPDSTMEEKDIVLLSMSEYKSLVKYVSNITNVAGTQKILARLNLAAVYIPAGLVMGGTAASAGLVTRGICGVTTPDANGGCTKENLYLNYDGDNNYSRPVVLGAGSAGNSITGGAHTYAAVRGDQMVAYVKNAIQGKANTSHTHSIADVTDLQSTLDGKANKSDIPTIPTNYVTTNTDQLISSIKTFNAPLNLNGVEQPTAIFKTANGGQIIFGKEGPNSGSMIGLDQVAGTRRLNFRASATPGAIVWSQPESGSSLFYDVANVYFRQSGYVAFNNASTINFGKFTGADALGTDSSGNLKKVSLASVATSGKYDDLSGRPQTGYTTSGRNYAVQTDSSSKMFVNVPWSNNNQKLKLADVDFGADDTIRLLAGNNISITGNATTKDISISANVPTDYVNYSTFNTEIGKKADKSSLSAVATSGSYNDLSNKPAIPDVSAASLTKNLGFGTYNIGHTWGLINRLAGYKVAWGADLPNGGGIAFGEANGKIYMQIDGDYYGDEGMRRLAYTDEIPDISGKADKSSLASVATSGSYNDLSDKPTIPTIPTKVSAFENDKGYKTLDDIIDMGFAKSSTIEATYATKTDLENKINGYIKNMTRIWQNGTAGISVGSTKSVNINNLRPAGASIHDTVIATSKDTSGRGTFCTTYYEVTDIDTDGYATLQSIGNYYSYDLPSNGTTLCTINGTKILMGNSMTINASPASGTKLGTINGTAFNMGGSLSLSIPTPGFKCVLTFDNTIRSYNFSSGNRILVVTPYNSHSLTIYSPSYTSLYSANTIMTTIHYTSRNIYYGNVSTGNISSSSSHTQININCSGPCMVYVMDW